MQFLIFQLEGFVKLKPVIIELATNREFGHKFETDEDMWEKINEILVVLKPVYIATKDMQKVGYGLADFCISWLRINKNLERVNAEGSLLDLATKLTEALAARKAEVFDTPLMLAAIYLDPRIKHQLSATQKECATLCLKTILGRLQIKPNETANDLQDNTLDELNAEFAMQLETDEEPVEDLIVSLATYDLVKRVDLKRNVMDFWREHKEKFPLLYSIACIIHAIPAGQCLEERNFSSFSYVKNSRRTSLKAENLQNILTIRLNKELFYEEKQKEINQILSQR